MTVLVELIPDRPAPDAQPPIDGEADQPAAAVTSNLGAVYDARANLYDRRLGEAMSVSETPGNGGVSRYPEITVMLDEVEVVVVDDTLFEQLFDIYAYHGWLGVQRVEQAIAAQVSETKLPGGVVVSVWPHAWDFFRFNRNLLALLIRDALVDLERRAAAAVFSRLQTVSRTINEAWTKALQVNRKVTTIQHGKGGSRKEVTYTFGNEKLANALFTALTDAVTQRVAYEKAQAGDDTNEMVNCAGRLYASAHRVIATNAPIGLLVLPGLQPGFSKPAMVTMLGETLWTLYERNDQLARGIDPRISKVETVLDGIGDLSQTMAWDTIERFKVDWLEADGGRPAGGPEAAVARAAADRLADDPGWLPLLHEDSLHVLVDSGAVPRDSFTYVVFFNYLGTLITELEQRRAEDEEARKFWQAFAEVAAALSLASLPLLATPAAPVGAGARAALQAVTAVADLILLAHTISSTTQQLARLNQLLDEQLIHPEGFGIETLGRLGQLGAFRRHFVESATTDALLTLVAIAAGQQWLLVRRGLMGLGYYNDLKVLLGDDEE